MGSFNELFSQANCNSFIKLCLQRFANYNYYVFAFKILLMLVDPIPPLLLNSVDRRSVNNDKSYKIPESDKTRPVM